MIRCAETMPVFPPVERRPRRHSYPIRPQELLPSESTEKAEPPRSASLEASPVTGIRLGSKIAKQAAKSFWNMDMLEKSLLKMKEYAAIESSSLGSSIVSVSEDEEETDPLEKSTEDCKCLFPIVPHLMDLPFSLTTLSAPSSRTQSPKIALKRSHSEYAERKTEKKTLTIPRKITPTQLTPQTAAKVRFHLSHSDSCYSLSDEYDYIQRNPGDDGFHEP